MPRAPTFPPPCSALSGTPSGLFLAGGGVLPTREALEGGLLGQPARSQTLAFLLGPAGTAGQSLRLAMG